MQPILIRTATTLCHLQNNITGSRCQYLFKKNQCIGYIYVVYIALYIAPLLALPAMPAPLLASVARDIVSNASRQPANVADTQGGEASQKKRVVRSTVAVRLQTPVFFDSELGWVSNCPRLLVCGIISARDYSRVTTEYNK